MTRGGKRIGAGRPKLPKEEQAKMVSIRLYNDEIPIIKQIVKQMHEQRKSQ